MAAMELFASKGFSATTMNDIVAATGLSKGGLYWHFKSKDDIIIGILDQFFDPELAWMQALVEQPGDSAVERLRALSAQIATAMQSMEALVPIMLEFFALAVRDQQVADTINGYYRRYTVGLVALLEQGQAQGELDIADKHTVALNIVAQFEGLALLWSLRPGQFDLRTHILTATELLLKALQPAPA